MPYKALEIIPLKFFKKAYKSLKALAALKVFTINISKTLFLSFKIALAELANITLIFFRDLFFKNRLK